MNDCPQHSAFNPEFNPEKGRSSLKIKVISRTPYGTTRSLQTTMTQLNSEPGATRLRVVESDILYAVGYAESSKTLVVVCNQGRIYHYFDVPKTVYQTLITIDLVDRYFRERIMGCYSCIQIKRRGRKRHR